MKQIDHPFPINYLERLILLFPIGRCVLSTDERDKTIARLCDNGEGRKSWLYPILIKPEGEGGRHEKYIYILSCIHPPPHYVCVWG
jgi:hypothetical protein